MKNRRFNRILTLVACAFALAGTLGHAADDAAQGKESENRQASLNTLTETEKAQGWQLLFNGKDLTGWRKLGRKQGTPEAFTVEDGTIHRRKGAPAAGDLITSRTYENFELSFDWKITEAANNGIKYNVSEELSMSRGGGALGFEYQVLDDARHPDGKMATHQCGALYDLIAPDDTRKKVNPIGEWNQSRIVFDGSHIEHWLNGQKLVEADLGTPRMDEALTKSKWNKIKDEFGKKKAGHIVITDHNDEVWFRNLKIRELPGK